jgi:tetratricopeptide (TPR) repeat protein
VLGGVSGVLVIAAAIVFLTPALKDPVPVSAATPGALPSATEMSRSSAAPPVPAAPSAESNDAKDEGASVPAEGPVDESPASMALRLESHVDVPACETIVGASWSLLTGDQPTRAMSEVQAGRRALIIGKLDEAQIAFCRATVLDAMNADALSSLARLYLMRRDAEEAKQWAERAAKQFPRDIEVQNLYGDALARVGETDRAVATFLQAVDVDASDSAKVRGVAMTYAAGAERALRGTDYAQADRLFRRAALLDPSSPRAAAGMARALLNTGEVRAALAWAKRAAALEPRDPEVRLTLGDALEKVGNKTEAYKAWKLAFELEPENVRANNRLKRIPADQR